MSRVLVANRVRSRCASSPRQPNWDGTQSPCTPPTMLGCRMSRLRPWLWRWTVRDRPRTRTAAVVAPPAATMAPIWSIRDNGFLRGRRICGSPCDAGLHLRRTRTRRS